MADQDTQLPVRSEADGTDERIHAKIVDYSDPGGTDKQAEVSEKLIHIRNFGYDSDGTKVQLRLSEDGYSNGDGIYDATLNKDPSNAGLIAHTRDATPADSQQTERITSVQDSGGTVRALDVSLHDEDGEPYGSGNPLPVIFEESEGDEIHDYDPATSVAKGGTSNHDYTVSAGVEMLLKTIHGSASGKAKWEIQVETGAGAGTFDTVGVFFNSTADPNKRFQFNVPVVVPAGVIIRVIKTNRDNQPQDIYSTVEGVER